jgi:hypothetical protein
VIGIITGTEVLTNKKRTYTVKNMIHRYICQEKNTIYRILAKACSSFCASGSGYIRKRPPWKRK